MAGRRTPLRGIIPILSMVALLASATPAQASDLTFITSDTTLSENHYGDIVINADDVTLDCAGHSITGTGTWFVILIRGVSGTTVKNCVVTGGENGVVLDGATGPNTLLGNSSRSNLQFGFVAGDSHGATLIENEASDNAWGFALLSSNGNLLTGNRAHSNVIGGFALSSSSENRLTDNRSEANEGSGFRLQEGSGGNLFLRNLATGNGNDGYAVDGSDGNTFRTNKARGNLSGLLVNSSLRNLFAGNKFLHNGPEGWGVFVTESSNDNRFLGNLARGNGFEGFTIAFGASHNQLIRNISQGSAHEGISLYFGADHNIVRRNEVSGNASAGILVVESSYNTIADNRAIRNNLNLLEHGGGISIIETSSFNRALRNVACRNGVRDAYDDGTGIGNMWQSNLFCTTDGI